MAKQASAKKASAKTESEENTDTSLVPVKKSKKKSDRIEPLDGAEFQKLSFEEQGEYQQRMNIQIVNDYNAERNG